ncbi:MAG: nucleotidyl transferase AbiEii/AbiGii toxin family protein [Verrucomicrobiota bacterium]
MLALADLMMRGEQAGAFRFLLIGGRALEAHGVVRFTKDVDFLVVIEDFPAVSAALTTGGYRKTDENAIFSRWKHPSMNADDVDVMYVSGQTFGKLMEGSVIHQLGNAGLRVPSVPSLIALKLHAMRSNPDRIEKDGRDIAELLRHNPQVLDKVSLETLFAKYGCSPYFSQFSHLVP